VAKLEGVRLLQLGGVTATHGRQGAAPPRPAPAPATQADDQPGAAPPSGNLAFGCRKGLDAGAAAAQLRAPPLRGEGPWTPCPATVQVDCKRRRRRAEL